MIRSTLPPLLLAAVLAPPAESQGTFTATGNMTVPRARHTATLLPNGKVLIAGGGRPIFAYSPSKSLAIDRKTSSTLLRIARSTRHAPLPACNTSTAPN
jgi:hypothetical protein